MHGMLGLLVCIVLAAIMALDAWSSDEPAPPPPSGDLVWRNGTMTFRLTERPCGFSELAEGLAEEAIPPVRALVMEQEGRPDIPGCWAPTFDDEVLLRDVGGGDGFMPHSWFVRE